MPPVHDGHEGCSCEGPEGVGRDRVGHAALGNDPLQWHEDVAGCEHRSHSQHGKDGWLSASPAPPLV